MASHDDTPPTEPPGLCQQSLSRARWAAASPLTDILEEMTLQMGAEAAAGAMARACGIADGALTVIAREMGLDACSLATALAARLLRALSPDERHAMVSGDFTALQAKAAGILGQHLDMLRLSPFGSWIHEPASDAPQNGGLPDDAAESD